MGFYPITNTTGDWLTEFVSKELLNLNLNIHNMRGQRYDNGAIMRGKHNGLQKRILNINPWAFSVLCSAHSLNLVVNDAVHISHETVKFFYLVQEIYAFFSASTKRLAIIVKYLTNLKLTPLSDTR